MPAAGNTPVCLIVLQQYEYMPCYRPAASSFLRPKSVWWASRYYYSSFWSCYPQWFFRWYACEARSDPPLFSLLPSPATELYQCEYRAYEAMEKKYCISCLGSLLPQLLWNFIERCCSYLN